MSTLATARHRASASAQSSQNPLGDLPDLPSRSNSEATPVGNGGEGGRSAASMANTADAGTTEEPSKGLPGYMRPTSAFTHRHRQRHSSLPGQVIPDDMASSPSPASSSSPRPSSKKAVGKAPAPVTPSSAAGPSPIRRSSTPSRAKTSHAEDGVQRGARLSSHETDQSTPSTPASIGRRSTGCSPSTSATPPRRLASRISPSSVVGAGSQSRLHQPTASTLAKCKPRASFGTSPSAAAALAQEARVGASSLKKAAASPSSSAAADGSLLGRSTP